MGLKSACDRLAAGLQAQAAARRKPFGLMNRLVMEANRIVRQMISGPGKTLPVKLLLILFAAGPGCLPLRGATDTNTFEFETPPPQPGSIQWETDHQAARELQDHYRKRVSIPDATGDRVSRSPQAILINGPKPATVAPAPNDSAGIVLPILYFAAFVLVGILIARKIAPPILAHINRRYDPWAPAREARWDPTARIREEEEAFAEFLKVFHVAAIPAPCTTAPEKTNSIHELFARIKQRLIAPRKLLQDIGMETSEPARKKILTDLYFEMGVLKDEAGFPEALPVWQVVSALEGLLKQLTGKTKNITSSTLRTVAGAVDLLGDLCVPGLQPNLLAERPFKLLVVDDDLVGRQALSHSLRKAFNQPDLAEDGESALALADRHTYDVIFLDVQMPGMDGFELCTKIRDTVPNRATPIVFVTRLSDFDARCKSTLSGGNDLMGKPFLTFEVTVKALTFALQGRLQKPLPKALPRLDENLETTDSRTTVAETPGPDPDPITVSPPQLLPPSVEDEFTILFLDRAMQQVGPLQEICQMIVQAPDLEAQQVLLVDGFLRVNSLIPRPDPGVIHPAFRLSVALEGLIRKMLQNSKRVTPSALSTVATAVDLLNDLCVPGLRADLAVNPPIRLLVVDDDLVTRRVMANALQTAFKKPESAENGEVALKLAQAKPFDVIFMDVVMPGMDGFEVCSKIRDTVPNRATPVVFVTSHDDFEAHVQMAYNGGDDLIGKPFMTSEVSVKALTFALRSRLQQLKTQPCP